MKTLLTFLMAIWVTGISASENAVCLNFVGVVKAERGHLKKVYVKVLRNDGVVSELQSNANGKFEMQFKNGFLYELVISKQGYYSKKLSINTQFNNVSNDIWKYKLVLNLLPILNGFDASAIEMPVVKIKYDLLSDEFEKDIDINLLEKYNGAVSLYIQYKQSEFLNLIQKGDKAFANENLELAKLCYEQAFKLNRKENHVDIQLEKIDQILTNNEKLLDKFDYSVSLADKYYETGDYTRARKYYTRALYMKEDKHSKDQLSAIEQTILLKTISNCK